MSLGRLAFAVAASAALCAGAARAETPRAGIQGEMKAALKAEIAAAIGETDKPIANRFEARRRANEASEDAIAVLRSEGYYAYDVEPDVSESDPPQPLVKISPGKHFVIADPSIEWLAPAPGAAVQTAGEAVMGLANGQAGRAADVIGAEGRIVAAVQKRGYADVVAAPRVVTVDHADGTVRPQYRIQAGEIVRLDGVELVTTGKTNPAWLMRMAPWRVGEIYDPEDVGELERRLLDTGVYDSVTVSLAPKDKTTADGLRPVVVSLADRAYRRLELGASYSTSEGAGADARWTRYNLLGRADTSSLFARASTIDSRVGVEVSLPHWRRAQQTLKATVQAYNQQTNAYDETGVGVSADIERRFRKTSYLTLGVSLDYAETDEPQANLSSLGRTTVAGALLGVLSLDRSDDPLDPKRGWRVETRVEPTIILGGITLPYLKIQTQGTAYVPFDAKGRTVLAARLKLGSIVNGTIPDVPASRRFYSGGGGSVRGYTYQAIGPHLADNTPVGGASVVEGSLELRQKIGQHWGVVGFVDAGAIGSGQIPDGNDMAFGVGLGVRYDLGFGPIRVDVGVPLNPRSNDPAFQVYLSIGQSF